MQETRFNPVDYGFRWTNDGTEYGWYEYDGKVAEDKAKAARDEYAAEARKAGRTIKKRSSRNNRITLGGIGTGHPHIDLIVPIYRVVELN